MGTAGDPAGWAAKVRQEALGDPESWRVSEPEGAPPWMSAADIELERRHRLPLIFARLFENRRTAPENRLASMEDLRTAVRLDGPQEYKPGVKYKVGADLGLRFDRTAICVCHAESVDGEEHTKRVVVDRMIVFEGTKANEVSLAHVEETLYHGETWRTFGRPRIRLDPVVGHGLAQRLRKRGVTVEEWSYSDKRYGAAAGALFGLLRDGLLDLYDHPALLDELATVRLRETALPGVVRVDHDNGKHDDMVQALGFAVTVLLNHRGRGQLPHPHGGRPQRPHRPPGVQTTKRATSARRARGGAAPRRAPAELPQCPSPSELSWPRCSVTFLEALSPTSPPSCSSRWPRGSPTPCAAASTRS